MSWIQSLPGCWTGDQGAQAAHVAGERGDRTGLLGLQGLRLWMTDFTQYSRGCCKVLLWGMRHVRAREGE